MKKVLTLCTACVLMFVCGIALAACGGGSGKTNAKIPTITTQPANATIEKVQHTISALLQA